MSTSGSKSNEHVAHFLVDIHTPVVNRFFAYFTAKNKKKCRNLKKIKFF